MNIHDLEYEIGSAAHALSLAEQLEANEETTLGPTDSELCAEALRFYNSAIAAGRA